MSGDPNTVLTRKFMELGNEVEGVEKTFVYPRVGEGDSFQRNLEVLVYALPGPGPSRLSIETVKGFVHVFITEHFLVGAVLRRGANTTLVEIILERMASNLEKHLKTFRGTPSRTVEKQIKRRIDGLLPLVRSRVALTVGEWEVGGEIEVIVTPGVGENPLRTQVEAILSEEIPFFCRREVAVEIRTLSVFADIGREKLQKVIEKVQVM